MNNPKIGKVYTFQYTNTTEKKNTDSRIVCKLDSETIEYLIDKLEKDSKKITEDFKQRKAELKPYFAELKKLHKFQEKRGYGRKSKEELALEKAIDKLQKKFFNKLKFKPKNHEKAWNSFVRYYIPENIELYTPSPNIYEAGRDINGRKYLIALYAGKNITQHGKIVHKWYNLTWTKIPESLFDIDFMHAEHEGRI